MWSRYKDLVASSVVLGSMITAVFAIGSGMSFWQVVAVFTVSVSVFLVLGGMEDLSNRPGTAGVRWRARLDWAFAGLALVSIMGWLTIGETTIAIASAGILAALVAGRWMLARRQH